MDNNIVAINEPIKENQVENIKNLIYYIRGKQVMLDSDVAMLYHYQTKRINETVSRNMQRFPEEFCFKLTNEEYSILKSQIATSNGKENMHMRGGKQKVPYVFTEKGIIMLSGLLKNEVAVQVSINIMDAFVEMRRFLNQNGQVFSRLTNVEYKLLEHDNKINKVFDELQKNKCVVAEHSVLHFLF